MSKIFAVLLAFTGLGAATAAGAPVQTLDASKLLYSMSTLSGENAPVSPVAQVQSTDFLFHEDEWRQVEFFPRSRLSEIQSKLSELKAFAAANARASGWSQIYLRKVKPAPVVRRPNALSTIARSLNTTVMPSPVLFYGQNSVVGRITNGFSLPLGRGITLYGISDPAGIQVLAANVADGGDDQTLVRAFATLSASDQLIIVDWRAQLVLVAMAKDGNVEVWRP